MRISVNDTGLSKRFREVLIQAGNKGVVADVSSKLSKEDEVHVDVWVGTRLVGAFRFSKIDNEDDKDGMELKKFHIIDRMYYPLEVAVYHLTKYLKKRKIKYIVVRDGIMKI